MKQPINPINRLMRRLPPGDASGTPHTDSRLESRPTPWVPIFVGATVAGLVLVGLGASALVKVDQLVTAPGKLEPVRSTQDLKAPEAGVVTAVYVKEGQEVAAGQPLALLDPTILLGRDRALRDEQRQLNLITTQELVRLQGSLGEVQAQRVGLQQGKRILEQQMVELRRLEAQGAASRFQLMDYEKQLADVNSKLQANTEQQRKLVAESAQKRADFSTQQAQNKATRVETETRLKSEIFTCDSDLLIIGDALTHERGRGVGLHIGSIKHPTGCQLTLYGSANGKIQKKILKVSQLDGVFR